LLKRFIFNARFAYFSLLCMGLMWVLPFLYPIHQLPLTTFTQEWGAAMLGLCAAPLLLLGRYWQQPKIPRIVLLPIGLMLLVVLQFAFGKIGYYSQTLLVALYLMWAALLTMLGQHLREELSLPVVATVLASFLLLGAELNTFVGVLQHFRLSTFLDHVVLVHPNGGGIYGNMGQQNHYSNYISLGLISLGLLHTRWQLRGWLTSLLATPMLFVLVLSGSRSTWLYMFCMTALAFLWQRRDRTNRPLLYYGLSLIAGYILMHFVVQIPWFSMYGNVTDWDRLTSQLGGGSIRRHIWYEAWLIFSHFPLLGVGFGQFGWQHFMLGPTLQNVQITGLYNNAHNLVMQIAAEMGLAGLLVLFGTVIAWGWQLHRAPRTIYHWWAAGVLAVLAVHSLLEYPLWYAYFLGIAALTLGILDNTSFRLELRNVGRLSVGLIILLGVLSLTQLWQGYFELRQLTTSQFSNAKFFKQLQDAHRQALLQPLVEVAMSNLMEGRLNNLDEMRELNETVMHYIPIASAVYREVSLLAIAGEQAEAQLQLERAIWAYPNSYPKYLEQWRRFAQKDPKHFNALLKFAATKYEEYQLAVHTK